MLVLSRKKNESIVIDGNIKIEVLKIKGNTVRIGIQAPAAIKVLRGELARFETDLALPCVAADPSNESGIERLDLLPNPFAVAVQAV